MSCIVAGLEGPHLVDLVVSIIHFAHHVRCAGGMIARHTFDRPPHEVMHGLTSRAKPELGTGCSESERLLLKQLNCTKRLQMHKCRISIELVLGRHW